MSKETVTIRVMFYMHDMVTDLVEVDVPKNDSPGRRMSNLMRRKFMFRLLNETPHTHYTVSMVTI